MSDRSVRLLIGGIVAAIVLGLMLFAALDDSEHQGVCVDRVDGGTCYRIK